MKGKRHHELVHHSIKGPGADCPTKSAPPFVSSEPAPHISEEGQPKNAGRSPRDYFCVSVPDEGVCLEDEVMGGDDLLGQRNGPVLPDSLSSSDLTSPLVSCHFLNLVDCFVRFHHRSLLL